MIPERNNDAVCWNRILIPKIFMILGLISILPFRVLLRSLNKKKRLFISILSANQVCPKEGTPGSSFKVIDQ